MSWVTVFTFLAIAVASLFARFRLGFSEWVFPGFSHTTIPKVQRNANLVDEYLVAKIGFDDVDNETLQVWG